MQGDISHRADSDDEKQEADDFMGLLTPIVKAFVTDKGFDNAVMAQQVFGGTGYTKDQGVEQFVRDARIAMIYEGANGIQALDLVGRKLPERRPRGAGLLQGSRLALFAAQGRRGDEALRRAAVEMASPTCRRPPCG